MLTRRQTFKLLITAAGAGLAIRRGLSVCAVGGSITARSNSYARVLGAWLAKTYSIQPYAVALPKQSAWEEIFKLVRITARQPAIVICDWACNNKNQAVYQDVSEALIRLITAQTGARLMLVLFGRFPSDLSSATLENRPVADALIAIGAHYGATIVDAGAIMQQRIISGQNRLTDWYKPGDGIHPNGSGQRFVAGLIRDYFTPSYLSGSGAGLPSPLRPDASYYETAPKITRWGIDHDGTSGSWSRSGKAIISNQRGASIQWRGAFRAFGLACQSSKKAAVFYRVDNGGWIAFDPTYRRGLPRLIDVLPQGEHIVEFQLMSGEWAVQEWVAI